MAFPPLYLLAAVDTPLLTAQRGLTDWLSIAAALGVGDRPAWARASDAKDIEEFLPGAVCVPELEVVATVFQDGKSCSKARQEQPSRA